MVSIYVGGEDKTAEIINWSIWSDKHEGLQLRYVEYYAQDEQVARAPVVSAFDLLYQEYDQSLARLNARLQPEDSRYKSEQIATQLLREALSDPSCQSLMWHGQVRLGQVASPTNPNLTERERAEAGVANPLSTEFCIELDSVLLIWS